MDPLSCYRIKAKPGLDWLRDLAVKRDLERLYIQCPDRLASGALYHIKLDVVQSTGTLLPACARTCRRQKGSQGAHK